MNKLKNKISSKKIKTEGSTGFHKKKKNYTYFIVVCSILYLLLIFYIFHYNTYTLKNPEVTWVTAIGDAVKHMSTHPFDISFSSVSFKVIGFVSIVYLLIALYLRIELNKRVHDKKPESSWNEDLSSYNKEYTDTKNPDNDILLSQNVRLYPKKARRNANIIVYGGSGTGKSRFLIKPNLLQMNSTYIVTDPSGELLASIGPALRHHGYRIKVLNLTKFENSDTYNPFSYIKNDKDVFILTKTLMTNTSQDGAKGDEFFDSATEALISALIFLLLSKDKDGNYRYPEHERNLSNMVRLASLAEADDNKKTASKSKLDELFDQEHAENPNSIAYKQYQIFKKAPQKTAYSIVISMLVRFYQFNSPEVAELTNTDSIHLDDIVRERTALFLVIPTADSTFNFISATFYTQLFNYLFYAGENECSSWYNIYKKNPDGSKGDVLKCCDSEEEAKQFVELAKKAEIKKAKNRYKQERSVLYNKDWHSSHDAEGVLRDYESESDKRDIELLTEYQKYFLDDNIIISNIKTTPQLPEDVALYLDEFKNIGTIPDFEQRLATIRKYRISCCIVYQSVSQTEAQYKESSGEIQDNCDTLIFLGGQGEKTAELVANRLGTTVIRNESNSISNGNKGDSYSYQEADQELATKSQLMLMDGEDCIVFVRGVKPFNDKKYEYPNHPKYSYTADAWEDNETAEGAVEKFNLPNFFAGRPREKHSISNVGPVGKDTSAVTERDAKRELEKERAMRRMRSSGNRTNEFRDERARQLHSDNLRCSDLIERQRREEMNRRHSNISRRGGKIQPVSKDMLNKYAQNNSLIFMD